MVYVPVQKWFKRETRVQNGYILVKVPEHPKSFCGGWYYEHRICVEARLGRVLDSWETVHHINENRTDNSPNNLFLCSRTEHDYADRKSQKRAA